MKSEKCSSKINEDNDKSFYIKMIIVFLPLAALLKIYFLL